MRAFATFISEINLKNTNLSVIRVSNKALNMSFNQSLVYEKNAKLTLIKHY